MGSVLNGCSSILQLLPKVKSDGWSPVCQAIVVRKNRKKLGKARLKEHLGPYNGDVMETQLQIQDACNKIDLSRVVRTNETRCLRTVYARGELDNPWQTV
ncbi:hypothetical protein CBL_08120 [Carabus blaptoides fortunei]